MVFLHEGEIWRQTHGKMSCEDRLEAEIRRTCPQVKEGQIAADYLEERARHRTDPPSLPSEGSSLFTPCCLTSGIQNSEMTHFCVSVAQFVVICHGTLANNPVSLQKTHLSDRSRELLLLMAPSIEPAHIPIKGLEVGRRMGPWIPKSWDISTIGLSPRPGPGTLILLPSCSPQKVRPEKPFVCGYLCY